MSLADRIAVLSNIRIEEVRRQWRRTFNTSVPDVPVSLLRRALAYEAQERAVGGLPPRLVRAIEARAHDPSTKIDTPIRFKVGTRLTREWHGRLHHVLVVEDGYVFEARQYRSLSQIAWTITGARWSGPRFFGLSVRPHPPVKSKAEHG